MQTIVAKFGGTSLADAAQIQKAVNIIRADAARRYVVASAPGKRSSDDIKVTDLLYRCHAQAQTEGGFAETLKQIAERFAGIVRELGVSFDLDAEIAALEARLRAEPAPDYAASRGEYLNSKILAAYLGWPFVDAAETVFFTEDGALDGERTFRVLGERLSELPNAVIPGFYGVLPGGEIHTFSRGGSDVTGAIVARAANASLYENWTDVSGMLSADPRIVENPRVVDYITYTELRELSYMGASVLHEEAVFPVRRAGIPINIRNTNRPDDPGTMIVASLPASTRRRAVTGVAGRKGFSSVRVEKTMMNGEVGFGAELLNIFARNGLPFEHCPTGIDTMSVVVSSALFEPKRDEVLRQIRASLNPDVLTVEDGLAVIAVVGQGMVYSRGMAARVFQALAGAEVNVRMIDQGSDELNIIVAVEDADYETAVRALYDALEGVRQ